MLAARESTACSSGCSNSSSMLAVAALGNRVQHLFFVQARVCFLQAAVVSCKLFGGH
jgi:hypothetical protein